MKNEAVQKVILNSIFATISLLLAGNIFFIKKLVDQLDRTTEIVWQLRQDVVILKTTYEIHNNLKLKGE